VAGVAGAAGVAGVAGAVGRNLRPGVRALAAVGLGPSAPAVVDI
jgi:hypothetical protein